MLLVGIGGVDIGSAQGGPAGVVAQQQRRAAAVISGTVRDAATERPVAGGRVSLVGSREQAVTDENGAYRLSEVEPGLREVQVTAIGYQSRRQSVTVTDGGSTVLDIALVALPYNLGELVVTATGEQRRLALGHTIGRIGADSLVGEAPIRTLSDLLQGRVPGLAIAPTSGAPGSGAIVRIRGISSVSLTNAPLLFVDGVRVESSTISATRATFTQTPSRLNDINPDDIENVQVIKGPSASTLYGPEAANGVLLVTTRRGKASGPRWTFSVEQGVITDPKRYQPNYASYGRNASGTAVHNCYTYAAALGTCSIDSVTTFSVLFDVERSPIASGRRQQYGANVSGGTDAVRYYVSGEYESDEGPYRLPQVEADRIIAERGYQDGVPDLIRRPGFYGRYSFRSNVAAKVAANGELNASVGYLSSNWRRPLNDGNGTGLLYNALLGPGSFGDAQANGGWRTYRPGEIFSDRLTQGIERFTSSLSGTWSPFGGLSVRGVFGYDLTQRADQEFCQIGECPTGQATGNRAKDLATIRQYTGTVDATASYPLGQRITARTTAGLQYFRNSFQSQTSQGSNFIPGSEIITGSGTLSASESRIASVTVGALVEQQVAIRDRLFLTAAGRIDRASSVGTNFTPSIQPRFNASYLVSEESWFPRPDWLGTLRLRAAWGEASVLPTGSNITAALQTLSLVTATVGGTDYPGVILNNAGNGNLRPETSSEIEAGLDFATTSGAIGLEATFFQKTTRDALIFRTLAPSLGVAATQLYNLGSTRNEGLEVALVLRPFRSDGVAWDATFTGNLLRNRVRDLGTDPQGNPIPPFYHGNSTEQRIAIGYPLYGFWARPIVSYGDVNGDGLLAASEITVGDTAVYAGSAFPTRELAFNTSITFKHRVRIAGQVDYRGGHKVQNGTEASRCATALNCRGVNDPSAPLDVQAAAVARVTAALGSTPYGFIEKGDFVRFRELSVSYLAPTRVARLVGAQSATLLFAVRNLGILTGYSGSDPEVNGFGGIIETLTRDNFTQPPTRSFIVRASLGL